MEEKKMILKAKKQDMMECLTCPICNKLYDRATTISECVHTFCKKCIEDKIVVEKLKACPVCNVDLGVAPLDKLRADNTWDDLVLRVFKTKPENVNAATETVPISRQYSRKKKKAPSSSLLPTSARVTTSPDHPTPDAAPLDPEKLGEKMEAVTLNQSSSTPVLNFRRRPRKNPMPKRDENDASPQAGATASKGCNQKEKDDKKITVSADDLRKSLTLDKEEVTPLKPNGKEKQDEKAEECAEENQNTLFNRFEGDDTEEFHGEPNEMPVLVSSESDTEDVYGEKPKKNDVKNLESAASNSGKKKSSRKKWKGKGKVYSPPVLRSRGKRIVNGAGTSQAALFTGPEKKLDSNPVWFKVVAASNQNTDVPLPQITPANLKVEYGNIPVSHVKKYIVEKLGLESEDEVEIWLREEPVCSSQILSHLRDWWVQTTPMSERKSSMVGSSAAEFVMVLHYSRSHLFF
ncbi:unnamed protein product [Thlaspi arvense]|uniref:RING-type domain-containing protein n=1 Tax=Thlaspi arvense TaxID=13288 RepID=A0AAU9RWP7_THLAR|nr:unnamed protein product [Thlaspi arvense]